MARKTSEEVFELIKSLTPSEKRYFKLFSGLHTMGEQNKYLILFDMIDEMNEYNEKLLIDQMTEKGPVTYSKLKKYLYDLLLKALRNFNSEKSCIHQMNLIMSDITVLFQKNLFEHAHKQLIKAEKMVEDYQLFEFRFLIENWRNKIALHYEKSTPVINNDLMSSHYNKQTVYLKALVDFVEYERNHSVIEPHKPVPPSVLSILTGKAPSEQDSIKVQFMHYRIQSLYFRLGFEYMAYLKASKLAFDIATDNPALESEDVLTYMIDPLADYCNALLKNSLFADYNRNMKKLMSYINFQQFNAGSEAKANFDAKVKLLKSEYDRVNGRKQSFEEHISILSEIESNEQLLPSSSFKNVVYWEIFNWQFYMEDYGKSLETLDAMEQKLPDFQTPEVAQTLRAICLYELGWNADLEHLIRKNKTTSILETVVLQCLKHQLYKPSITNWMKLKPELKQLHYGEEKIHFRFFDFIDWVNKQLLSDDTHLPVNRQLHYYHA